MLIERNSVKSECAVSLLVLFVITVVVAESDDDLVS